MDESNKERLQKAGYRIGSVSEFLALTPEESAIVEVRLALSNALRERRKTQRLSQATLAQRIESSQSRVAKMEAGKANVSIDLLMRALLATGATREEVGKLIASG